MLLMLSFDQCYKEVRYLTHELEVKQLNGVYAYIEDKGFQLSLIRKEEFVDYDFIGYKYHNSFYPNVKRSSLQ